MNIDSIERIITSESESVQPCGYSTASDSIFTILINKNASTFRFRFLKACWSIKPVRYRSDSGEDFKSGLTLSYSTDIMPKGEILIGYGCLFGFYDVVFETAG